MPLLFFLRFHKAKIFENTSFPADKYIDQDKNLKAKTYNRIPQLFLTNGKYN